MKLGVFIGSFNPPTNAHFEIGKNLYKKYVDKVIYLPVNSKKNDLLSLDKRIMLIKKMISNCDYMMVSDIMLFHDRFNYVILEKIKKSYNDFSLYIILGSDLLEKLKTFDNYQELLQKYYFIVIPRFDIDSNLIIKRDYLKYKDKFIIYPYSSIISSSLVRKNIKEQKDFQKLVPRSVYQELIDNNFYQD